MLALEFLGRFYLQRPLRKAQPDSQATSMEEEKPAANVAATGDTRSQMPHNVSIVVYGIALATLFVLIRLVVFHWNWLHNIMLISIYFRTIYRTVELIDGWTGHIITTEKFFNILDGAPITLAMFILNALHPRFIV